MMRSFPIDATIFEESEEYCSKQKMKMDLMLWKGFLFMIFVITFLFFVCECK